MICKYTLRNIFNPRGQNLGVVADELCSTFSVAAYYPTNQFAGKFKLIAAMEVYVSQ